ncbi:MAG: nucleoside kinase, partial [Fusobacterium sp.]
GSINKKIFDNEILELILLNETLHNKKIASIADQIIEKKDVKLITIAGPSSSGKTTFSKKLLLNLKTCGVDTLAISLDDYYIGRANVPLDENGEKDFETIEALDIKLLNENLKDLIDGKETKLPLYNFNTGERKEKTRTVKLPEGGIIIIEGIHGLNDELTKYIPRENKFKIYISCLTQINMDMHNRVHTTDVRKIRRIVRDSISRKTQGEDTLAMWHSIRKGEEKWIFPFQEDADEIFNSSLSYELCVLKPFALKELIKIGVDSPEYDEAKKLADLLSCFVTVDQSLIPTNSILKEFIGGSIFYKY